MPANVRFLIVHPLNRRKAERMVAEKYPPAFDFRPDDFDAHVKVFHELMREKIREILLVSTPYDAFIMEEDGSLTSKIINEYKGLNLSRPPRLTKAATADEAMRLIRERVPDLVITMPALEDMDTRELVMRIKAEKPDIPVILLAHRPDDVFEEPDTCRMLDNQFVWTGNAELLLALVKSVEDRRNVDTDTGRGMVRVLILVEDSPLYRSIFLPLIYKVVVRQTLHLTEETVNEEHRLLKMRARPKILLAENYETALALYRKYRPYVFGVISDTRFPRECVMTPDAGAGLLSRIKAEVPHLPLLLMSNEPENRQRAEEIRVVFIDKNSPRLEAEIEQFFLDYLGFGDFVFRLPDKTELGRACNLWSMQKLLPEIPDEPLEYHARRNHFSNWLMARSEVALASMLAPVAVSDFDSISGLRDFLITGIRSLRRSRRKGAVVQFSPGEFDPETSDFVKIGGGSLGGKARGLAFLNHLLHRSPELKNRYPGVRIRIPKTLVIATDGFDAFIGENTLHLSRFCECSDGDIRERFLKGEMPARLREDLKICLRHLTGPLSVRSSSLLEDAYFQSYAGLYKTYMIPNSDPDPAVRLRELETAVKLVYASTYFETPLTFARNISLQFQEDRMAVIIQQAAGSMYGDYFYPALSGAAQSRNFYPVPPMASEEGIARVGMGMGRILEEGEATLRFSPRHPSVMPQFSTVDDILTNAQRFFYALKIKDHPPLFDSEKDTNLEKREISDAEDEYPVRCIAGTYIPEEHRIRDSAYVSGPKIITLAPILKFGTFPLAGLLTDLLELGHRGIGSAVEIEFAVDFGTESEKKNDFHLLQIRPMSAGSESESVRIFPAETENAFCYSESALGHGSRKDMADIVYVRPETFDPAKTAEAAEEIGRINAGLKKEGRPYLLAGFGRWGSSDRWLGIPVSWENISGVGALIEIRDGRIRADASGGSHFFQKITARGIPYITLNLSPDVRPASADRLDWNWLNAWPEQAGTRHLRHIRLDRPFLLKNDGIASRCVLLKP